MQKFVQLPTVGSFNNAVCFRKLYGLLKLVFAISSRFKRRDIVMVHYLYGSLSLVNEILPVKLSFDC